MIDLGKLVDLLSEKMGTYHTRRDIYEDPRKIAGKISRELGKIHDFYAEFESDEIESTPKYRAILQEWLSDVVILATELAITEHVDLDYAIVQKLRKNYNLGNVLLDVTEILPQGARIE